MDDSFAYRTTVPIRRELDPRLIRAAVGSIGVLVAIALFATWVVASERRSFERAQSLPSAASEVAVPDPIGRGAGVTDAEVEEALGLATDAARRILAADGSLLDATPARLGRLQRGYTYVDGPSTTARVVSVASTRAAWAAAVLGSDDACVWITMSADGSVARSAGAECTGAAALASIPAATR